MKAIILAAGMGTRLKGYAGEKPKSTLKLRNKKPLILNTVEKLESLGIKDITLVLGYKYHFIEEILKDKKVTIHVNPFYACTNSAGSLYFAREKFDGNDDIVIMNGDSHFDDAIWQELLLEKDTSIFVDESRKDVADAKVKIKDDYVVEYNKDIEEPDAESTDLMKISRSDAKKYISYLKEELMEKHRYGIDWEGLAMELIRVKAKSVFNTFWSEVDTIEDYERLVSHEIE